MKERPIIFSDVSVRAIQADLKSMTRRVVKRISGFGDVTEFGLSDTPGYAFRFRDKRMLWNELRGEELLAACPYGQTGDRLWVRETWAQAAPLSDGSPSRRIAYQADGECVGVGGDGDGGLLQIHHGWLSGYADTSLSGDWMGLGCYGGKWRSSIHMPRWASRLTLEVTAVRVERLQAITNMDAKEEGFLDSAIHKEYAGIARDMFVKTWDHLNAKRGFPWELNPWCWVVEFKRIEA